MRETVRDVFARSLAITLVEVMPVGELDTANRGPILDQIVAEIFGMDEV